MNAIATAKDNGATTHEKIRFIELPSCRAIGGASRSLPASGSIMPSALAVLGTVSVSTTLMKLLQGRAA